MTVIKFATVWFAVLLKRTSCHWSSEEGTDTWAVVALLPFRSVPFEFPDLRKLSRISHEPSSSLDVTCTAHTTRDKLTAPQRVWDHVNQEDDWFPSFPTNHERVRLHYKNHCCSCKILLQLQSLERKYCRSRSRSRIKAAANKPHGLAEICQLTWPTPGTNSPLPNFASAFSSSTTSLLLLLL